MKHRYELDIIATNIDIGHLTTEANNYIKAIEITIADFESLMLENDNGTITVENANKYILDINQQFKCLNIVSTLTTENSQEGMVRSALSIDDFVKRFLLLITEAIKNFINIFKQLMTKIMLAMSSFDKKAEELLKLLETKSDMENTSITDIDLKQQVFDLIGAYTLQNDTLKADSGIATALVTPKDYNKLPAIISGLGEWNDALLGTNAMIPEDLMTDNDYSERHKTLLDTWNKYLLTRKIPGNLLKIAINMSGNLFGASPHVTLSGYGTYNWLTKRVGTGNLAFIPYGLDGDKIYIAMGFNQGFGNLFLIEGTVKYDIKTLEVDYPTIHLMSSCLRQLKDVDYKGMSKDIDNTLKDIEKNFKDKINGFVKGRIENDPVKYAHITTQLRTIYFNNINVINNVSMSIVRHTLRNTNNLVKYIDLMSSQLPNK